MAWTALLRSLLALLGWFALSTGVILLLVALVALFGPVGTPLANDHDRFGTPAPASEALILAGWGVLTILVGVWLVRMRRPGG